MRRSAPLAAMVIALMCGFAANRPATAEVLDPDLVYQIKPGDTLYALAGRYLVGHHAFHDVQRANHIRKVRALRPGASLRIPFALLRTEPLALQVSAFSGQVTGDVGAGPAPVRLGASLGQGAVITTAANAFVTLELPDGSRMTLPSLSRVRVARLRRILINDSLDRVLAVEQGRSESVVTPMTNPASRYIISTPVASAAVRGTVFRVSFDPASGRAATEVVKGAVGFQHADTPEVRVGQAFGAGADQGGVSPPVPLLPPPDFVRAGRVQDQPKVTFAATPAAGAKAWRVQLANDAGFVDIFAEATSSDGAFSFDTLADGTYFMRATAIDEHQLEGLPRVYSFTRELNALEGGKPVAGGDAKMRRYLFRWNVAGAGDKTFHFRLFRAADLKSPLVDELGLKAPLITLTDIPPGSYVWTVEVATFRNGRYVIKSGEPQTLDIGQ